MAARQPPRPGLTGFEPPPLLATKDPRMGPLDAVWHVLNFFAPAAGVGVVTALVAKLLWRRELAGVGLKRLGGWSVCAGAAAQLAGLVIFGRDGKMASYAAMVCACAAGLWAAGFVWPRR